MCHMSRVACHLSPVTNATATEPPPANYPNLNSRLVPDLQKERNLGVLRQYFLCSLNLAIFF